MLVVVSWGRKVYSGPAEISSVVYRVQFKDVGHMVSLRLHLLVSDVDPRNEILCARGLVQTFSFVVPEMESFFLDLPRAVTKGCSLEVGCVVCGICGHRRKVF